MMTTRRKILMTAAALAAGFASSGVAQADQYRPLERPIVLRQSAPIQYVQNRKVRVSAAQAKSIAMQRVPGAQVVDVALQGKAYRVRLIRRDGRVVDVYVDAATGRVR